jgi:hypothetical protein
MTTELTPPNGPREVPAHGSRPGRTRRLSTEWLAGLALMTVATLVAVGSAELFVRIVAPQQLILVRPDVWIPVDTLGWMRSPNQRTTINTGERTVNLVTDGRGFRFGATGPSDAQRQVLLLGDSFMEALQVEYEESLAGLIETALASQLREPVTVRNTAVGGWGPSQYLLQASRTLETGRYAAVVVAVYLGNDIEEERKTYFPAVHPIGGQKIRMPSRLAWSEFVAAVLYPINQELEQHSHLFVLLKERASELRIKLGLSLAFFPSEHDRDQADAARWDVTASVLEDIALLAREAESTAIFLLVPSNFQVHPAIFESYARGFNIDTARVDLEQPNRIMRDLLQRRGLQVVDPLEEMRAEGSSGPLLYGLIDTHLTARGHAVIARELIPVIAGAIDP